MLLDNLVQTINTVISDIDVNDVKLTVGCLLYSYLVNQENKVDLRNKARSFKDYYLSLCLEKKNINRTIGYIEIEKLIESKKYTRLSEITIKDYEKIIELINSDVIEEPFEPRSVNPRTYGKLDFSTQKEREGYSHLHNKVLKPIAIYLNNKYSVPYSNLKIVKVFDTISPAKEVDILIKDFPSITLIGDIKSGNIIFIDKPSVVRLTKEGYVHIIV